MRPTRFLYFLFFLSGLAGLIYEIVWGRLLVLIFGSTTNSLTATISAFLGGLALGSVLVGRISDRLSPKTLLKSYSIAELLIGLTALTTPFSFQAIKYFYAFFSDGSTPTPTLIFIKFLMTSLVILVPTTLMGATLPLLVRFIQSQKKLPDITLSLLYAINTFGGMAGVLLSAFVTIELIGLYQSITLAALINILVSILAWRLPLHKNLLKSKPSSTPIILNTNTLLAITAYSFSGFVSIAYQILWTRVLTPAMGTVIYVFALILAFYLFGLAIGSFLYPQYKKLIKDPFANFGLLQLLIGLSALIPVLILHKLPLPGMQELTLRLFVPTLLLGMTFPSSIALINQPKATGSAIGLTYLGNTIGAILGGYTASFLMIPLLGSTQSIVLMTLVNFTLAFIILKQERPGLIKLTSLAIASLLIITSTYLLTYKNHRLLPYKIDIPILESQLQGVPYAFKEDDIASVFAKQKSRHNEPLLVIDGVATTHRVSLTKYMAHLPIILHPDPQEVLIIAFGMGNTYRSSLKHNIHTTAIELVPSVVEVNHLFHSTPPQHADKGRIVVNDGRNYAFLTPKKYDIVIIDPPPPFNTAGSTVLHSKEYYLDLQKLLNKNGLVNQWIYSYGSRRDDISMAINTFLEVFPYVTAVQKADAPGGIFMLGSMEPITNGKLRNLMESDIVFEDLKEFEDQEYISRDINPLEVIGTKDTLTPMFKDFPLITDTHPRTEYHLLRHRLTESPILVDTDLIDFVEDIKLAHTTKEGTLP